MLFKNIALFSLVWWCLTLVAGENVTVKKKAAAMV